MFSRVTVKQSSKDEAEKPFWISFADLMTAMMVLFLVVMSVALLAVTKTVNELDRQKAEREAEINQCLSLIEKEAATFPGISIDRIRYVIDFGDRARFDTNSSALNGDQKRLLRAFVPRILTLARAGNCQKWQKHIVVEGFADKRGTYLLNLNLSLQRSQRVLCTLMEPPLQDEAPIAPEDLDMIRELFLVGGYSFNSSKASPEASRRIELRLEFLSLGEKREDHDAAPPGNFGVCSL